MQFSRRWWLASKSIHVNETWQVSPGTEIPGKGKLEPLMSLLICGFLIAVVGINWCWCHFWSCGAVLSTLHFQRAWHPESHSMFGSNLLSTCHVQESSSRRLLVKMTWQILRPLKLHLLLRKQFMAYLSYSCKSCRECNNSSVWLWSCIIRHVFQITVFSPRWCRMFSLGVLQRVIAFNKCFYWFEWDKSNSELQTRFLL